jgi:hypothetical protein
MPGRSGGFLWTHYIIAVIQGGHIFSLATDISKKIRVLSTYFGRSREVEGKMHLLDSKTDALNDRLSSPLKGVFMGCGRMNAKPELLGHCRVGDHTPGTISREETNHDETAMIAPGHRSSEQEIQCR